METVFWDEGGVSKHACLVGGSNVDDGHRELPMNENNLAFFGWKALYTAISLAYIE